MRKVHEELKQKEERLLFLSNKVGKNKMQGAEMAAELQSLQAGEERRGSNASQTGDCCLEALWEQLIALGTNGIETFVQRLQREMGTAQGQMPGREESQVQQRMSKHFFMLIYRELQQCSKRCKRFARCWRSKNSATLRVLKR